MRFWELSGGILRCASCGRAMQTTSIPSHSGNVYHYYRCPRRVKDGKESCDNAKNLRADHTEPLVWGKVSELFKRPDKLGVGLETMIERKRAKLREDPEREAAAWLKKLEECAGKRTAYQDQQAAGLMTLDELAARLSELEDGRRGAERELARIRDARTEIETFEADAAALLAYYERVTPEHIDALSPEQRHHAYRTIRLEALAHPDGSIEVTGDVLLDVSTLDVTHAREGVLN